MGLPFIIGKQHMFKILLYIVLGIVTLALMVLIVAAGHPGDNQNCRTYYVGRALLKDCER